MAEESTTTAGTIETPPANGDANRDKPTEAITPPEAKPKGETAAGDTVPKSEVESIVRARLKAFEDDQKKKAEKDQRAAVAAALREQGDFARLAEAREAEVQEAARKIAELEPEKARADRYEESLKKHLAAQRKGLPKHIVALLDRLDVADQLDYLAENAEAIAAAAPAPETKPNGSTPARRSGTTAIGETTPQLPLPPRPLAAL